MFILCAFLPTVVLIFLSYGKVVGQLEEQSIVRLKRDAKAYGLSLFDRMLRIDNELQAIGRMSMSEQGNDQKALQSSQVDLEQLFTGIAIRRGNAPFSLVFGAFDTLQLGRLLTPEVLSDPKPFIITMPSEDGADIYFGCNMVSQGGHRFSVVALVKKSYFWGIGSDTLLPPLTELLVFDISGEPLIATQNDFKESYQDIQKQQKTVGNDPRLFQYARNGQTYLASVAGLFIESHFQRTGWTILLSQNRADIMATLNAFNKVVPFIMLLFLLLILYLSMLFIRKGLQPLEQLKEGTRRIARKEFTTAIDIKSDDEFRELGNAFNDMAAKLDNQFNALLVLGEIDRAILSSLERAKIIRISLQRLKEFFSCAICLYVKNSASAPNHVKTYFLEGPHLNEPQIEYFQLEEGEDTALFSEYNHKIINDRAFMPSFFAKCGGDPDGEYLALPLEVDSTINRVLILGWKNHHAFYEDEVSQARKIANHLAIAITNALHSENLEKLAVGTIEALARTVDAKSKWTSGHSERVAVISGRIGNALKLGENVVETIIRGGLLHDIGKIGIRLSILDKPDRLTDEEYQEIKNHPAIGGKILEPIKAFQDILPLIVQHHEKFDGTGYPAGLKGEEIDLRARIMAVADVWDALTSNRPYREGWGRERAIKLIADGSGSHFDPRVVNAFLSVEASEGG